MVCPGSRCLASDPSLRRSSGRQNEYSSRQNSQPVLEGSVRYPCRGRYHPMPEEPDPGFHEQENVPIIVEQGVYRSEGVIYYSHH